MAKTKRVAAGSGSGSEQFFFVNRNRPSKGKASKKSVAKRGRSPRKKK